MPTGIEYHLGHCKSILTKPIDEDFIGLFQGTLDNPRDSARRLVLADWFEEHGRHTEAVMQKIWAIDPEWNLNYDSETDKLVLGEETLTPANLEKLRNGIQYNEGRCFFSWRPELAGALSSWPWEFGLDYYRSARGEEPILPAESYPNLKWFETYSVIDTRDLDTLIARTKLRGIRIPFVRLTQEDLDKIAKISTLELLHIYGLGIEKADYSVLSKLDRLKWMRVHQGEKLELRGLETQPSLETFEFAGHSLDESSLPRLTSIANLRHFAIQPTSGVPKLLTNIVQIPDLKTIRLFSFNPQEETFAVLGEAKDLVNLHIQSQQIDTEGLNAICEIESLRCLSIDHLQSQNGIPHNIENLTELTSLYLPSATIPHNEFSFLKGLPQLNTLDLSSTTIDDVGCKNLRDTKGLYVLELARTEITDAGLQHLKALPNLFVLEASSGVPLSREGLKHLQSHKNLQSLWYHSRLIDDAALEEIIPFEYLRVLSLSSDSQTTEEGRRQIQERLPYLNVRLAHY